LSGNDSINGNKVGQMRPEDIVVEVNNVWKIFGKDPQQVLNSDIKSSSKEEILEKTGCVLAMKDISFKVNRGEVFVIMGLSGSGKSTLIRCILRLIEPTTGSILIHGKDICQFKRRQLDYLRTHTTAMVFQHFGLFPHRTVIDNVAYGLQIRGMSRKKRHARAEEVIKKVGLKGWEKYYPGSLSGGMQQRVGIARALATDPEILLLDEPFGGLDPLIRRQMQDELFDIQAEFKKTILFVTHDLHGATRLGNRIALMRNGEIIQIGTPQELITEPKDEYVRRFVQDAILAKVLTASSIMSQPGVTLYEWHKPDQALQMLAAKEADHAFVVDRSGKFLGLLNAQNLSEQRRGQSVIGAMEKITNTCTPESSVESLFPLAAASKHPIPVVDEDGKLLEQVETSAIFNSMIRRTEEEKGAGVS